MTRRIFTWTLAAIIVTLCAGYGIFALYTSHVIVYGVSVDGAAIGGRTIDDAKKVLAQKAAFFEYEKITLTYNGEAWTAAPHDIGATIDIDATARNAYAIGRGKNIIRNIGDRMRTTTLGEEIPFVTTIDETRFADSIARALGPRERAATDASLHFDITLNRFVAIDERPGITVNKSKLKYDLLKAMLRPADRSVTVSMENDIPLITKGMLADVLAQANVLFEKAPIALHYTDPSSNVSTRSTTDGKKYEITKEQIKDLLAVIYRDNAAHIDIRRDALNDFLVQIAPSINMKPRNAVLTVKDGKVKEFSISKSGIDLDVEKSTDRIREGLLKGDGDIDLIVTATLPEIRTETIENLGLIALLGKGESDFSGSPASRIFNIKLGAEKLNGVLIKPGDEFSFMRTIGGVDAKEGYQFALVIKNGKDLVKEYGGGLCQVSTTMFRAAIYSGLPITERSPHSLPVSYYNPQGFDAAVYSPHPDLRFINDTPSNILVQTKVTGSKLYFEFYGMPDGREVKLEGPAEYDRKPDGSLKAKLTQQIYKDDTLIATHVFTSSYRSPKKEAIQKNPLE